MSRPTRICDACSGSGRDVSPVYGIGSMDLKCRACDGSGERLVTDGELLELIWDRVKDDGPKVKRRLREK